MEKGKKDKKIHMNKAVGLKERKKERKKEK